MQKNEFDYQDCVKDKIFANKMYKTMPQKTKHEMYTEIFYHFLKLISEKNVRGIEPVTSRFKGKSLTQFTTCS